MVMIKNKDDFYEYLWQDYISFPENEREKSFIFGYLKKKKDSRAEVIGRNAEELRRYALQKKKDKYTLLKSAYLAFVENGVIDEQEYTDIIASLGGSLDKQQMLERRFLMSCVHDYFYNLGYRTNKNDEHGQSVKLPNKHLKEDGYNDEFEMMYEFSIYSGKTLQADAHDPVKLDDEYIGKCQMLYKAMLKEKRRNAFVPLYVDNSTGAGVYIIGSNKFDDENIKESCLVCVLYFLLFDGAAGDDISLGMLIKKKFRTVREAFDYFSASVQSKDFYENYPFENDDGLPQGIDEDFNLCFLSKSQDEDLRQKKIRELFREKEIEALREVKKRDKCRAAAAK